jgi:hypothetical protein
MFTRAVRIDEAGTVQGAGRVEGSWPNHILLWQAGTITDLGVGGPISMNDRGQIVLQKQEDDDPGRRSLCYLWAYDINGSGFVAGQVDDRAAFWQDGRITRLDLHSKNSVPSAICTTWRGQPGL